MLIIFILFLFLYQKNSFCKNADSNFLRKKSPFFLLNDLKCKNKIKQKNQIYCGEKKIKKNEFHDRCIINVKGGNGGDGICCFTTFSQKKNKKYASGGRGGKGGDIYLIGDKKIDNFLNLKLKAFYYAGNGGKGCNNNQQGENGKDEYINIPINTIIYEDNKFINFIHSDYQKVLVAKGGKGGKGNYSYRTKSLKIPYVCQFGEKTKEKQIILKKIFFTDLGIIGYPNVGKSTLLNKITNANVKIANYSYTSLFPNFGIYKCKNEVKDMESHEPDEAIKVEEYKHEIESEVSEENEKNALEISEKNTETCEERVKTRNYTVIDFPGIIEGLDKKLSNVSYKYLEHLKYSKVLIYMFDINDKCIVETYKNIKNVLVQYDQIFEKKKEVVILNKIDIYQDKENINTVINYLKENLKNDKIFCISALTGTNVIETIDEIILNINKENIIDNFISNLPKPCDIEQIENSDNYPPNDYKIHKYNEHIYIIKGKYIENQADIFNFSKDDSEKVFNKILNDLNINVKLKNIGAKEGDKIIISNYSYDFSIENL
ncbi:GTP-binding protein, putative [Plasmodium chabaudi adami]|uniref:GTP-binding protein, putative n=1 Tax=Plasmodium chabaudi adami TaxID=5826 RepID=A0A1C6XSF7_PLACE|nr:GTP-binding protein, putative [Plasmodium chabaudi adami]